LRRAPPGRGPRGQPPAGRRPAWRLAVTRPGGGREDLERVVPRRRPDARPRRRARRDRRRLVPAPVLSSEEGAMTFCGQCGTAVAEEDAFCRACGAPRRPPVQPPADDATIPREELARLRAEAQAGAQAADPA